MSSDYLNPFDSNKNLNLNSITPESSGGNFAINYRKISKELDEDRVEIRGKNPKKAKISFGKNIQKATQDGVQFLEKKTYNLVDSIKKKFEQLGAIIRKTSLTPEEVRADLHKFLTSKKISKIRNFNEDQIGLILKRASRDNIALIKKMCINEEIDDYTLESVVNVLNEHNILFARKMYANNKIHPEEMVDILSSTTEKNIKAKMAMYDFLKTKTSILPYCSDVLATVDETNLEAKIKAYKYFKTKVEQFEIPSSGILTGINPDNFEAKIQAFDFLKASEELSKEDAMRLASYIEKFDSKTKKLIQTVMNTDTICHEYFIEEMFSDKELTSLRFEIFDLLEEVGDYSDSQVVEILMQVNRSNASLAKILSKNKDLPTSSKACLLGIASKIGENELIELIDKPKIKTILSDENLASRSNYKALAKMSDLEVDNLDELFIQVEKQRAKALENPQLYVNGEYENLEDAKAALNSFFDDNKIVLARMFSVLDKEAMNNLLRMRTEDASLYVSKFLAFDAKEIELLKSLANSCNLDNKPLMPTQKIELIDLLLAYKQNKLDTSKMVDMVEAQRIDIGRLNIDLFGALLKQCGLSDDEIANIPSEKLLMWDIRHIHLLAQEIRCATDTAFSDVMRASNLDDFKGYILDINNAYGKVNAKTKAKFNRYGMNYNTWINPENIQQVQFAIKDKNKEALKHIAGQIIQDIEALRQTPAKGFIDKRFAAFIDGDKFVIPEEYITNKAKLSELVQNLLKQLDGVFKRAQGNLDNPTKATTAQNTLTINDHLKQRLLDIGKIQNTKSTKTYDLTIKMWDRTPQKDIFQGNYSTCCIGMGGGNGSAMPHYLLNTSFNMIELVDNNTGETIGNALCYFVLDGGSKPALVIDNIEIRNSQVPSLEIGKEMRVAIVQYAKNIAQAVTGSKNTRIYMSGSYNDVAQNDLTKTTQTVQFLGETECDSIYMDLYGGWVSKDEYKKTLELLKLGSSK